MSRLFVPITSLVFLSSILLILHFGNGAPAVEVGQVKCMLFVNFTEQFYDAHRTCYEKMEKEVKEEDTKEAKGKSYPYNATIEDFEWDDKCVEHCIYEEAGIIGKDNALPKTSETETLFSKGKVSDDRYTLIITAWNECIEISEKISKEKKFDKCKTVTHHRFCFNQKMYAAMESSQVEC